MSESVIHFKKSCEGGEGGSSTFAGASFTVVVMTGEREGTGDAAARETTDAADKAGVAGAPATDFVEVEAATEGRAAGVAAAAFDFPPNPTVVHAPPV